MELKYKIGIGILIMAMMAAMVFIMKMQHDIIEKQKQIETSIIEFKSLDKGIVRLESKYVENQKALEDMLAKFGVDVGIIKEDLKKQGAQLDAVAVVSGNTPGLDNTNLPSDFTTPAIPSSTTPSTTPGDVKCTNKFGYCEKIQGLNLYEPSGEGKIPFGAARFDATKENPWSLQVYPRQYNTVLTISKDNSGRVIAHSKMSIDVNGEQHAVSIRQAEYKEIYEASRFYWWNPRISGTYGAGLSVHGKVASTVAVHLYPFSIASNKSRPVWMFAGIGAGYEMRSGRIVGSVSPVMYNVVKGSQLVQNLYVGLTMEFAMDGGHSASAAGALLF